MSVDDIVAALHAHGVRIVARGDDVVLAGKVEQLGPALVERARTHKSALLTFARGQSRTATTRLHRYDASFGQARLAFTAALRPGSAAYNVASALVLRGPALDVSALTESIERVIRRHPSLQTGLEVVDGRPMSCVWSGTQASVIVSDLSHASAATREHEVALLRRSIAEHGFDLTVPPLWRCHVVRISPTEAHIVTAVHHFIADGWSLARALREMAVTYDALVQHRTPGLRPLAATYADYAGWQRQSFDSEEGHATLAWWSERLSGIASAIDLPTDRPRPAVLSDRGDRIAFALEPELARSLRRFAAERSTTVSAVMSAVHAVLLHRYSGSDRFFLGIAVSHRPTAAFHDVFGFFVNWLPVSADFSDGPTFATFLTRWQEARLAALRHQDTPFDAIARTVKTDGDLSRHSVFQHMVVSHVPARGVRIGALKAVVDPLSTGTSKLDMTLFLTDTAGAVEIAGESDIYLEFEYSTDLFERATVESFGRSLTSLLAAAVSAPSTRVTELSIAKRDDAGSAAISIGGVRAAAESSVLSAFRRHVERQPDATAIVCGDRSISYRDLYHRAAAIASALDELSIGAGDRVVLLLPRNADLVAALLGTWLVRGCVVPIDRSTPPPRVLAIAGDADASCVLTMSGVDQIVLQRFGSAPIVFVDQVGSHGAGHGWARIGAIAAADLSYLLYTSGSTGRPKGVLGAHGSLANFVSWLNGYLAIAADDRVLAKTPLGFDASLREIVSPLGAGASIVLADDASHLDPDALVRLVASQRVTIVHGTPTIYRELLAAARRTRSSLQTIRHVMCGGEPLNAALAEVHFEQLPHARLHNVYGPTECTIDVTVHEVMHGEDAIPIGRAITGATVYVAAPDLSALPRLAVGEIVIGGVPTGPGYWRLDEQNDRRFALAAAGPCAGQRVFRTGDLGRALDSGELVHVGRIDRQIKIRGARVEPEEIERVTVRCAAVSAAAVVVAERPGREATLIVFVELKDGATTTSDTEIVRRHLDSLLPRYMQPERVCALPRLPKTVTGKVDYSALQLLASEATIMSPTALTPAQAHVATVMSELLERPILSADADFFQCGGHSLLAARLIGRLAHRGGVVLTLGDVFESRTVAAIASVIEDKRAALTGTSVDTTPIQPVVRPKRHA